MSSCTHDCSTCGEKCSSRTEPQSFIEKPHAKSNIKNVIGVVSGKGGVGKSLVTSMLASMMNNKGFTTAVLDADITGPTISKTFGAHSKAEGSEEGIYPVLSSKGVKLMSINFLLQNETDPVVWRGPVIAGAVKQFWTDVIWGDVEFMFVDMPPGTGDVPLTVFQSLPLKGIVVVTSPQELVSDIVEKAVNMAKLMNVPILGLVENMSYFVCLDCNKKHYIYGKSNIEQTAEKFGIENVAYLPIDPKVAMACDKGEIEEVNTENLDIFTEVFKNL